MEQGFAGALNPNHPNTMIGAVVVTPPLSDPAQAAASARTVGRPVADPAPSTLKLYAGEWAGFVAWCRAQRRPALPASAETLAAYLLSAPALSQGALGRRRAAIGAMHRQAGLPAPVLDAASRKALRAGAKPAAIGRSASPPGTAGLLRIAAKCPRDLAGLRDRALLLLVAATASPARQRAAGENNRATGSAAVPRLVLLALEAEHVRFTAQGVTLQLQTRLDDAAPSHAVTLTRATAAPACPARALEDWLRGSGTHFGPVFRKVDRWGNVEHRRLGPDAWYRILARRGGTRHGRLPATSSR